MSYTLDHFVSAFYSLNPVARMLKLCGRPVLISYAQKLEDVMLNRVFPGDDGFYIDVGAQHPRLDSVTYAFYRRGWRGLNIEPSRQYSAMLQKLRPGDINLPLAISDYNGAIEFHEVANSGLSTTVADYAREATNLGFREKVRRVPCMTLDQVCLDHTVTKVNFLKIDVEGAEKEVLAGFAFDKIRPIVLVIEATVPCTTTPSYQAWEPYVLDHGYKMVHDDGLNRFYLANEHPNLESRFLNPPNDEDRYKQYAGFRDVFKELLLHGPEIVAIKARQIGRQLQNAIKLIH